MQVTALLMSVWPPIGTDAKNKMLAAALARVLGGTGGQPQ
jgi:hypothetical protein